MKYLLLMISFLYLFADASSQFQDKELLKISGDVKPYIIEKYLYKKPLKPFKILVTYFNRDKKFASIKASAIYENKQLVENEYIEDVVFTLCIEKINNQWKVVFDLSRTDVPSAEEMNNIVDYFPNQFPKKLLPPFWQDLFKKTN